MVGTADWLNGTHFSSIVPLSFYTEAGRLSTTFSQTALQLEPHRWYKVHQGEALLQDISGKEQQEVTAAAGREIRSSDKHNGGGIWCPEPCVLGGETGDRWHWQSCYSWDSPVGKSGVLPVQVSLGCFVASCAAFELG